MKKILVVDDRRPGMQWQVLLLKENGYDARGVTNGRAALELLKKHMFDLAIVDLLMPEMSGLTLIKRIRSAQARSEIGKLGIIVITAYSNEKRAIEAVKVGADDYIKRTGKAHQQIMPAVRRYFRKKKDEDYVLEAVKELVESMPNPNRKLIASGGTEYSAKEILRHISKGDEVGRQIRRAILGLHIEFASTKRRHV